jgi:integrase/recombinase XerD
MADRARVRVGGPLEPYARGFAGELARRGYMPSSAQSQLRLMAHVSRWLAGEGLDAAALTPALVARFVAVRRASYTNSRSSRGLGPLVGYLRDLGVTPSPVSAVAPATTAADELLARYRRYLTVERGLALGTARLYVGKVRPFLVARSCGEALDLRRLTAGDVSAFVLAECPGRSTASAKHLVTALRSFLRFLHLEGVLESPLAPVVPSVAGWRLAGIPRALEPGEVQRLLASCDRRTTLGRRDFAILLLLARLGLRRGEVARLKLDDLDWRAGELVVCGKGNRAERLPLPVDVGDALAGYLRHGRAGTAEGRWVFVTVRAPHRPLSPREVGRVAIRAGRHAGIGEVTAHRLRHTAATSMIRAGASLPEIGQVLRHRRLQSTAIYAKVDREALRSLARPWPGGVS